MRRGSWTGVLAWSALFIAGAVAQAAERVRFTAPPAARATASGAAITFAVSGPTDVEVAILDAKGAAVRHLAAGVLGAANPPPEPLKPGLAQTLAWDRKDDFGKPAAGGPFRVRVRAGTGVRFDRFIGADPYNFGRVVSSAVDEEGNIYVLGFGGQLNQGHMCLRVFDKEGRYLREILPFPANLPKDAMKDVARWDEAAQAFRPQNHRGLNPDFYGQGSVRNLQDPSLILVSASKKDGVVLAGRGGGALVLETSGAVRERKGDAPAPAAATQQAAGRRQAEAPEAVAGRLTRGTLPMDWNRLAVDYDRDEVYVNDGVYSIWRFDGSSGDGTLLKVGGKIFFAADLAVGYDGLLYVRKCMGYHPGVTDFSGPFHRYTRDLAPAPYASGTHVLSDYIYGRYGVGYADRGIGPAPDGSVYISFMHGWHKYCLAGFGPDGKALKGLYLEGKVGGNRYPPELTSAIIGPLVIANSGVRVDLKGNIYLGLREVPRDFVAPAGFELDPAYKATTGSVVKFGPQGGTVLGIPEAESKQPEAPRVELTLKRQAYMGERAAFATVEGALAVYPGMGPFSGSGFGVPSNLDCVCRVTRFDLDRYGRLYMTNAVTNSVKIVDNAGNLVCEFGRYGNFDSQYVNVGAAGQQAAATVAVPAIPLTWPTGAGVSEKAVYVLDTYSRRLVRLEPTCAAEALCDVGG